MQAGFLDGDVVGRTAIDASTSDGLDDVLPLRRCIRQGIICKDEVIQGFRLYMSRGHIEDIKEFLYRIQKILKDIESPQCPKNSGIKDYNTKITLVKTSCKRPQYRTSSGTDDDGTKITLP